MLLRHDSEQLLFEALKAGASGYVLKPGADTNIIEACRAALLAIRSSIPRRSPRSSATTSMRLLDRGCGRIEVRWRTRHRSPGKTARRSSYHLGIGCAFSTQQAVDLACVSISHSSEPTLVGRAASQWRHQCQSFRRRRNARPLLLPGRRPDCRDGS